MVDVSSIGEVVAPSHELNVPDIYNLVNFEMYTT